MRAFRLLVFLAASAVAVSASAATMRGISADSNGAAVASTGVTPGRQRPLWLPQRIPSSTLGPNVGAF